MRQDFYNYRTTKKWVEDITISFEEGAAQGDFEDPGFIIEELKPSRRAIELIYP